MSLKANRWIVIAVFVLALTGTLAFGQEPKAPSLDAGQKQAIVDEVSALLNKNYIFADTARKLEDALRARLKNGGFDAVNDAREFAQAVSASLLEVGKDKHMGFAYNPEWAADIRRLEGQSEEEKAKVRERQLQSARRQNFGFRKVEQLAGNIGYVDFRGFMSPDQAGETAIAAMNFLAYCDAIIIDLRQNGGGDPAQIQLISSYFFDEPAHLNDLYYRAGDSTRNYWTLPYVPGPKAVNADLYILTSGFTFSGAEEFTYNMKNLKRATVIGETTGGGAHPTDAMIVHQDFILRVPIGRAINPVSKTNWEGTGVAPDVAVPAAEAFDKAYAMAVEKLAAKAADPERKAAYDWILTGLKAKAAPPRIDAKTLKSYVGVYGERKVALENGALVYQRTGPKYRLIPMTATLFAAEGLDYFRVEFVIKDGKAVAIVGHYDNGTTDSSPRTK
jgi:retinol-binding protein 3